MATYPKGTNGVSSGKAGHVIGSNWRNIDCPKGLPCAIFMAVNRGDGLTPIIFSDHYP